MARITIFGLAGTGTSTVGRALAEKLGYQFVSSGDMFRKKAKDMGLDLSKLQERAKGNSAFDQELDREIGKIGEEKDNIIVESRLAWHFIPNSIKIKLSCDFEVRVKRLAERDHLSFEQAEVHVREREKVDDERYQKFYGIENINNDSHFDLIIDTTMTNPAEIVGQISTFIKKDFQDT